LGEIRLVEEPFTLAFDEWFDRGTPSQPKTKVRQRVLGGPGARGYYPTLESDGSIRVTCWRSIVRGVKVV
jgi:hypothetical protein